MSPIKGARSKQLADACFESFPTVFTSDDCAEMARMPYAEAAEQAKQLWLERTARPSEFDDWLKQKRL